MPLNIMTGDFVPYLKYNSKAGRFYVRAEGSKEDVEITKFIIAIDFEHIRTGWIHFPQDGVSPPEKFWGTSVNEPLPTRPSLDFKRGFEVMVFSKDLIPGTQQTIGLRSFCSNAWNTVNAINKMYVEYEKGLAGNPGKYPVYAYKGASPIEGTYGTNYEPVFKLNGWADKGKITALTDSSKLQILPPTNGGGKDHFQTVERAGYKIMDTVRPLPKPEPDPAEMSDEIPF